MDFLFALVEKPTVGDWLLFYNLAITEKTRESAAARDCASIPSLDEWHAFLSAIAPDADSVAAEAVTPDSLNNAMAAAYLHLALAHDLHEYDSEKLPDEYVAPVLRITAVLVNFSHEEMEARERAITRHMN